MELTSQTFWALLLALVAFLILALVIVAYVRVRQRLFLRILRIMKSHATSVGYDEILQSGHLYRCQVDWAL